MTCAGERAAFAWSSRHVAETQERLLCRLLRANRGTWYGARHGFDRVHSPRAYQERVPAATYADLAPLIERIGNGEANVLTTERVDLLEPTSGTTGGEKLIPYTAALRRQFQRGVAAWIADLFWQRPAVRRGRAYWSISPALGPPRHTSAGIPIGFTDDAAYLGRLEQFALRRLLVTPAAITRLPDLTAFRYCTLLCLLAAEDLALVSVWNPTFLLALLRPLPAWQERLCDDLRRGTVNPPVAIRHGIASSLMAGLRPQPRRAARLRTLLRSSLTLADKMHLVWPRLALLSCWTDAAARQFLPAVRELFPAIEIQPKGLLATEAFVSFPLMDEPGAALAVRSHFFEFEESDGKAVRLAHELESGGRYRVLVTTAGGLYRYQLRDEIEIVGFWGQCPLLRFLGKSEQISDLVGEKLAEAHVRAVLDRLPVLVRLAPRFALLVPVLGEPPRYRLYLQGPSPGGVALPQLCRELQTALEENPYYRHAAGVGQLAAVEIALLDPDGEPAWQLYENRALEQGQKCGDVKPSALDRWTGWPERFAPLVRAASTGTATDTPASQAERL